MLTMPIAMNKASAAERRPHAKRVPAGNWPSTTGLIVPSVRLLSMCLEVDSVDKASIARFMLCHRKYQQRIQVHRALTERARESTPRFPRTA